MNSRERAGQLAYEAFYAREGVAVTPWHDLPEQVQDRWMYAGGAVSSFQSRMAGSYPENGDYTDR